MFYFILSKKEAKGTKGKTQLIRRTKTVNAMAKKGQKRKRKVYKTQNTKLMPEQHKPNRQ